MANDASSYNESHERIRIEQTIYYVHDVRTAQYARHDLTVKAHRDRLTDTPS